MEANELRIGNLIKEGKVEQIDNSIDEVYYSGDGYYQSTYCCNLNPIPLTEEWLLKFGFEKNFENLIEILINKNQSLHFDKTDNCMSLYIPINHEFIYLVFKHIKYVHQLQNLYFSLTGTELEIKQ